MQSPSSYKEDQIKEFSLADLSSVFDHQRPGAPMSSTTPESLSAPRRIYHPGSRGSPHSHSRSISSSSASSLASSSLASSSMSSSSRVDLSQTMTLASRNHPSLQQYSSVNTIQQRPDSAALGSVSRREYKGPTRTAPSRASRRTNSVESEDDDNGSELEPLPLDATEEERKIHKRKANTLAARRSRAKRQKHLQFVETENQKLKRIIDQWKQRVVILEGMLKAHNIRCPENISRDIDVV